MPLNLVQAKRLQKVCSSVVNVKMQVLAPRVFKNLRRMHDLPEETVSNAF